MSRYAFRKRRAGSIRSGHISVYLDVSTLENMRRWAEAEGVSLSTVARRCVSAGLEAARLRDQASAAEGGVR